MSNPNPPAPPMPDTQEVWEAHWAFYRLAILERDHARMRAFAAEDELKALRARFDVKGDTER